MRYLSIPPFNKGGGGNWGCDRGHNTCDFVGNRAVPGICLPSGLMPCLLASLLLHGMPGMKNLNGFVYLSLAALFLSKPVWAGEADVVDVAVRSSPDGAFHFDVTVRHADAGWKHYADAFEIVGPKGSVLGTRVLLHPHETEQPFTRSLGGVRVPVGIGAVDVRAV